jgi:putative hemolysin
MKKWNINIVMDEVKKVETIDEKPGITMIDHLLIRDGVTGEELLNKQGTGVELSRFLKGTDATN